MAKRISVFAIILIAACAQQEAAATDKASSETSPAASPAVSHVIAGRWRVGQINDEPLIQPHPIFLDIDDGSIVVSSQCVRLYWNYDLVGDVFSATSNSHLDAIPGCDRELTTDEQRLSDVLPRLTHAQRGTDGRAAIYSDNSSITLMEAEE